MRFHPSRSDILASGSLDNEVKIWNSDTAQCIASHDFRKIPCLWNGSISTSVVYVDYLKSIYLLFIVDYVLRLYQFGPLPQLHFMLKEICWPLLQAIRYQLWTNTSSNFFVVFYVLLTYTFSIIIIIICSHGNCSSCIFLSFTYGNTIGMQRI